MMRLFVTPGSTGVTPADRCLTQTLYQNAQKPDLYMVRVSNDYIVLFHTKIPSIGLSKIDSNLYHSLSDEWILATGTSIKVSD